LVTSDRNGVKWLIKSKGIKVNKKLNQESFRVTVFMTVLFKSMVDKKIIKDKEKDKIKNKYAVLSVGM